MIQTIKDKYGNKVVAGDLVAIPELQENEHIALPLYMVMQVHEGNLTAFGIATKRVRTVIYPQTDFMYVDATNIADEYWHNMAKDIDAAVVFLKSKNLLN